MEKTIKIGKYPCKIIKKTDTKILVLRLDMDNSFYEVHKVRPTKYEFYKTTPCLDKANSHYNSLK